METQKRRYKIKINDKDYTIIGKTSPEHMRAVVKVVQHQLDQVQELMPTLSAERASILLAINAVSDQLTKQDEIDQLKKQLKDYEQQAGRPSKKEE